MTMFLILSTYCENFSMAQRDSFSMAAYFCSVSVNDRLAAGTSCRAPSPRTWLSVAPKLLLLASVVTKVCKVEFDTFKWSRKV